MNQAYSYFEPVIRKQRIGKRVAGGLMLVLCAGAATWAFSADLTDYSNARLLTLAAFCIPVSLIVLIWSFRQNKGLLALSEPSRIVWYYGVNKGGQVNAVMIGLDDGRLHRLPLPLISIREGFCKEGLPLLRVVAPHATSGFTEALRKSFKSNPSSLKN